MKKEKIKLNLFIIAIIVVLINFIWIIEKTNGLTGCESLTSELCYSSYPKCAALILTSCCPGQTPLCFEIDVVINYLTNKERSIQNCLINLQSNAVYELWGAFPEMPEFKITPVPNTTCKDLGCEQKGFDCIYESNYNCAYSKSVCCQPVPKCTNFKNRLNFNISFGKRDCDIICEDGYKCRIINEIKTCVPSRCDIITCPHGTECRPLDGLDIVSCFKTIEVPKNDIFIDICSPDNKNTSLRCRGDFECSTFTPFSTNSCIPENFEIVGAPFDCNRCPKDWLCFQYGWSGYCAEYDTILEKQIDPCEGGPPCLSNQFCNTTSLQCEYFKCTNETCHPTHICHQQEPTSPRFCASDRPIWPLIQYPTFITPFMDVFEEFD